MNLNKIIKFLSTSIVVQGLNLILTFFAIKFLGLSDLGRYNIAKSIAGTFQFANLGLRYGLDRRLPESKDERLNSFRMSICAYLNTICSIAILFFFICYYGFNWFYIIYGIGGAFIASFTLIRVYLRGTNKIDAFIKATLLGGVLPILFSIIGLLLYELIGLGIAFLLSSLLIFILYSRKIKLFSIREVLKKKKHIFLFFKVGNIIYLTNLFEFIANNFDRFAIESFAGLDAVGEYGIVILVFSLSLIIPGSVLEMLFPEYIKDKKNKLKIISNIKRHLKMNMFLIGVFVLVSFIVLPYLIPIVFVKYTYLVNSMQFILFALLPYIVIGPIYALLFAFDQHKQILYANIISTISYFILLYAVISQNYNIMNLVFIKIIYAVLYLVLLILFLVHCIYKKKIAFK